MVIDSPTVTAESIEVRRVRAEITRQETERPPLLGLWQAHRDFGRILRDMRSKQQENLQQLSEAKAELTSTDATSHLKYINHRELRANDYAAVRKVTNTVTKKRGGGGINLLRMEHEDSQETLIKPLEISRALRDQDIRHYGQANATPFGMRDVFDKLT